MTDKPKLPEKIYGEEPPLGMIFLNKILYKWAFTKYASTVTFDPKFGFTFRVGKFEYALDQSVPEK